MNWSENRNRLVSELREAQLSLRPPRRLELTIEQIRANRQKFDLMLEEYVENVPRLPVSRCPICGEALELAIDLEGLDSPWWWDTCPFSFTAPKACAHFQLFLGGVDLHGRQPTEVDTWGVIAGPGVPYVVERLLAMEGMQATVSELKIGAGDTGYLVAYFSETPVPQDQLHQEWRRQTWYIRNEDGAIVGEDTVNDPWDFELTPWLETGKLNWIDPGDASLTVRQGSPSPFENLEGVRDNQTLANGEVQLSRPPSGTPPEYFAPY